MKSFTDLAQHLSTAGAAKKPDHPAPAASAAPAAPTAHDNRLAAMAAAVSLEEPVVRRGIVEHCHKGGSVFAALGDGSSVFVTRSIARRLDLAEGDILDMTIVGNFVDSRTASVPYRALFAVRVDEPLARPDAPAAQGPRPALTAPPAPAPAPEPAPVPVPEPAPTPAPPQPRLAGLGAGTVADRYGPEFLGVMRKGYLYSSADFVHLFEGEQTRHVTNVLLALYKAGHVQMISVHTSEAKRAAKLYWTLPGQGPRVLDRVCAAKNNQEREG